MIYPNKIIPINTVKNVKSHSSMSRLRKKNPHVFELVFFEDGREKMVLAEGSAAFMQWTKNEMRNAPPYNHGLLSVRHKGVYRFEDTADRKHRTIRIPIVKRRNDIKHQKETRCAKQLVAC